MEPPILLARRVVPEIAFRAGKPRSGLGPLLARHQAQRLGADAHEAGPEKRVAAPRPAGVALVAHAVLGELHPAFEQAGVMELGPRQIAHLQRKGPRQVHPRLAGKALDQDAAGARIAHVQHQLDIDRRHPLARAHRVGKAQTRDRDRVVDQPQIGEIARPVLEPVRQRLAGDAPARPFGALVRHEQIVQPVRNPFLQVQQRSVRVLVQPAQEPVHPRRVRDEAEIARLLGIGAVGAEVLMRLRAGHQRGVQRQLHPVRVPGGRVGAVQLDRAHPRPGGGAGVEAVLAAGAALGLDPQHRHRHPFRQERLKRRHRAQCPKVGDGMIGWHIMAVFTCRDSRRERDMPHERRYDFAVH